MSLGYRLRRRIRGELITKPKLEGRGQYIDKNGYSRYKDTDKLVHRQVAEKYIIKRKLLPYEEVHHINGNKLDNSIQNLRVLSISEHKLIHFSNWLERVFR